MRTDEGTSVSKIIAYKAFDADWTCLGFKYEIGKTYTHDGAAKICESGFHACENPLDVLVYYPPTGRLGVVELDATDETSEDSKRVGKELTVKAALTIAGFVSAAIEYTTARCDSVKVTHSTGYWSASSATGNRSVSSATGYRSASSTTGDQSASSTTGDNAIAAAFGLESTAAADKTGIIVVAWWDGKRKRLTTGYVGEDGIEPNVAYRCDNIGKLTRATP